MSARDCSRLRVTHCIERSKMRQHDVPARKNRKYGTPSDGTASRPPKTSVPTTIGISGRASSQKGPRVIPS